MKLTDESIMPFGMYSKPPFRRKMANVPAKYLMWLWDKQGSTKPFGEEATAVRNYINENLDVLKKEVGDG